MKTTKKRADLGIRPVFDARTLRAVIWLCCGLGTGKPLAQIKGSRRLGYLAALDAVMDRCLAHLPYAKGATPDERKRGQAARP